MITIEPTPVYVSRFPTWDATRTRLGHWDWRVTDGHTGPVLASGTAHTRRGADRAIEQAFRSYRFVRGDHRGDRPVLRPLDQLGASLLTWRLQLRGVAVTVRVDGPGHVVLWPVFALTPEQEALTLHLVLRATDAPVRWAGVA
ncbi:hypothetical protein [Actinoplanes rectilineatus]|uniref:hypothetical protein n=1 Tax=Actinoplanes rectilineatus TaxID=113571 RepID=UPI0005F28C15|nr:hypothetical protein [Actinoplanes rectilineatus]